MSFFLLCLAGIFSLWKERALWRAKHRRELFLFLLFLGLAFLVGLGKILSLPSPFEILGEWLVPVGKSFWPEYREP